MSYVSDDGYVITKNDNTQIQIRQEQVPGYEQFVASKRVKIIEGLPPVTDYKQCFSYITPIMTSNNKPSGKIYSDITGSARDNLYKMFSRDNNTAIMWQEEHGWVTYEYEEPVFIKSYIITTPNYDENAFIKSWKLFGSVDNRNWVELDSRYNQNLKLSTKYNYTCRSPHFFRFIKFSFSETKDSFGYALMGTLDYFAVSQVSFLNHFDKTAPLLTHHTDHTSEITEFDSVRDQEDFYKNPDPFGDDSCMCYLPFDGSLEELTGKVDFFNPSNEDFKYIEKGYKDRTALNYMTYNNSLAVQSVSAIPVQGLDAITVCAWVKQDWYNFSEFQNIWLLAPDVECGNQSSFRVSSLFFNENNSTSLYYSLGEYSSLSNTETERYTVDRYKWNFISVVQGKDFFNLYINGKLVVGRYYEEDTNFLKNSKVVIGSGCFSKSFQIMDFRVFNRELSLTELFALESGGETIASFKNNRFPEVFTIVDNNHKINGKTMPLKLAGMDVIKKRKKFRYIDHRMFHGNSVGGYAHITEIQTENDSGTNDALGKPVKVYYQGNGNATKITDGDTDPSNGYYTSQNENSYTKIDLGEPKDIRYIRLWHYYLDGRYYKDIKVMLSNNPSNFYNRLEEDGYIFDTEIEGTYTETALGLTISNLNYEYEFKVELINEFFKYPPEFFVDLRLNYLRKNSIFYNLFVENWRNLWYLKPRTISLSNETVGVLDVTCPLLPDRINIVEEFNIVEKPVVCFTPKYLFYEDGDIQEYPVVVIN